MAGIWPGSEAKDMTMSFHDFDVAARDLLERLRGRLGDAHQKEADDYWGHGEWGLLMEVVLDALTDKRIPLSKQEYEIVRRLVMHFQPPDKYFPFINNREQVLASLNVAEDQ